MSNVEVYAVKSNGNVELFAEIPNANAWSMRIWLTIEERFMSIYRPSYIPDDIKDCDIERYWGYKPTRLQSFSLDKAQEVWDMFESDKLTPNDRWVLGATYDNVIIRKENFNELIDAFRVFYPPHEGSVLPEQINIIRKMMLDEEIVGVAWSISLMKSPWLVVDNSTEFKETNDKEDGYEIPYNVNTGTTHWYLTKETVKTGIPEEKRKRSVLDEHS